MKDRHKNIPASYLVFLDGTKILLLRRYNTGYEDGNYSLVAGHVDPGETFTKCIIREAEEEAGVFIDPNNLEVKHVIHRNSRMKENNERVDVFFVVKKWKGKIVNKEPNKCDDLSRFDINNLPKNIIPYVHHALNCIANNIFYSEF
jgi:8-oxo-dGTP diphosphatase